MKNVFIYIAVLLLLISCIATKQAVAELTEIPRDTILDEEIPKTQLLIIRSQKLGSTWSEIIDKAKKGNIDAQFVLCEVLGFYISLNYREAFRWCQKAAIQGHIPAQSFLGNMYLKGLGVPQDFKQAREWLEKAAHKNEGGGQFLLGLMYLEGLGVHQDYVKAYMWINLSAAKFFNPYIVNKITRLRDDLGEKMQIDQLNAAQKLSREWEPELSEWFKTMAVSNSQEIPFTENLVVTTDVPYVIYEQKQSNYRIAVGLVMSIFLTLISVLLALKYRKVILSIIETARIQKLEKATSLPLRILMLLAVTIFILVILIFIDRVIFLYFGLEAINSNNLSLSLIPVLVTALTIRYGFSIIVLQKPLSIFHKRVGMVLFTLYSIHTTALVLETPKERKMPSDIRVFMLHSAAISTPEILIASIPYVGIPMVVLANAQEKVEEKALEKGEYPRDFWSIEEYIKAIALPPW